MSKEGEMHEKIAKKGNCNGIECNDCPWYKGGYIDGDCCQVGGWSLCAEKSRDWLKEKKESNTMSKMTHKRKCEIVEALKVNERGRGFWSDEENEVWDSIPIEQVKCMFNNTEGEQWNENLRSCSFITEAATILRIKKSYTVQIEPPEGYRLVTDEEMDTYPKPNKYYALLKTGVWYEENNARTGEWHRAAYKYAVQIGFSFEPESMTLAEVCKELGRDIKITK